MPILAPVISTFLVVIAPESALAWERWAQVSIDKLPEVTVDAPAGRNKARSKSHHYRSDRVDQVNAHSVDNIAIFSTIDSPVPYHKPLNDILAC
jgi:hypothetical protein